MYIPIFYIPEQEISISRRYNNENRDLSYIRTRCSADKRLLPFKWRLISNPNKSEVETFHLLNLVNKEVKVNFEERLLNNDKTPRYS